MQFHSLFLCAPSEFRLHPSDFPLTSQRVDNVFGDRSVRCSCVGVDAMGIPHDELAFFAGARNNTMQVKDLALAVLNDELDWLIKLFDKEGFNEHIGWRQNAPRAEWSGEDVIAYLSLLNDAQKDKVRCYVGAGRIISELKKQPTEPQNEMMEGLKKTAPVAVEWMRFIDFVHKSLKPWYATYKSEVSEKQSRFRQLAAVTAMDDGHRLVFLNDTIDYRVVKPWLMHLCMPSLP